MELSGIGSDINGVLDIYAEALKKQMDMAQKLTQVSLSLSIDQQKMDTANKALMDFYA
jgi:hypothetical protein